MKKLLVIMGAGSSIEVGMPSIDTLDKLLNNWAQTHFPIVDSEKFANNLYDWVKKSFPVDDKFEGDFEKTLNIIQRIGALDLSKDSRQPKLFSLANVEPLPRVRVHSGIIKLADPIVFSELYFKLNQELTNYFRKKGLELISSKESELGKISDFFGFLRTEYDLGFVNLNYDNVLMSALPNLNTGFLKETGAFDLKEMYDKDWNFCYHLHGSVHFNMRNGEEIFWNENLASNYGNGVDQKRGFITSEGAYHPLSTIITGLDKINQIYREPFRQYFFQLDRRIYESDAILFIGYGFNDSYLNELIRTHAKDSNKIRNIVVIDFQNEKTSSISEGSTQFASKVTHAVYSPFYQMGNGSHDTSYRPDNVGEYKRTKSFEFSDCSENPLYVWYSGFLNACENKVKVLKALKGYITMPDGSIDKGGIY